ncbi:MAG: Recombinase [Verrucomicrobiaceae bacterium]|nr:Recombinase [Verrucomicrobiaceae bacterium]
MRAAIYCRYSTDRQRETSIDDQVRVCRFFADREGWEIVSKRSDEEVSGSTPVNARIGGAALLTDAMAARFDVLLLEGLDRLSRDLVEQETIVRRLEYQGIRIVGVSDGYDSNSAGKKIHRGMRGLINEIYLDDLRHKTHRGQSGQVARGYSAGGGGYGYRSTHDGQGYLIEIVEDEAQWVRWVFDQFVAGWAARRIVTELNRLHVPSPRGSTWAVGAIYGSPAKGTGLLSNELYAGRYIWNRSKWVKNPDTGRRQRIERPQSEWQIQQREDLRIVSVDQWQAVRARLSRPAREGGAKGKGARPRTLLGGLMTCGFCGGAMTAVNSRLYGCITRHDRGDSVCHGVYAPRVDTDTRILASIRDELLSPGAVAELQREVDALLRAESLHMDSEYKAARSRFTDLHVEIERVVDAIAAVGGSSALQQRLQKLELERDQLVQKASLTPKAHMRVSDVLKLYKERVINLKNALQEDITTAREALREILGPIRVIENDDGVWAEVETNRVMMLRAADLSMKLVAGARFELTTFGL